MISLPRARHLAYAWYGGQESALYSFASTGGVVHSAEHKANLLREISLCKGFEMVRGPELRNLEALEAYIQAQEAPPHVETPEA